MFAGLLAISWMLTGAPPEEAEPNAAGVEARTAEDPAALTEYNALRDKTPNTAEAQWKLALWCETKGLKAESLVHLAEVLKLDPRKAAAWEKLGFKKRNGKWLSEEQLKDEAAQKAADKEWVPRLRKWHAHVHGGPKQAAVREEMAGVVDPRAVPAIYAVFGRRGASDQAIAVQLFGQIPSADASKGLAVLAVYGVNAEVRGRATQTLRQREPDDYLGILVGLLTDLLKYEIRPVGGPGSPGVLMVEGERFSVRRFYSPPPPPTLDYQPGDLVTIDEFGLPVITRRVGQAQEKIIGDIGNKASIYATIQEYVRVSLAENLFQAQTANLNAQAQLRQDEKEIQAYNKMRRDFNEHVLNVARAAMGEDLGKEPEAWRLEVARRMGATEPDPKRPPKPILDMLVPLAYQPIFGQPAYTMMTRLGKYDA